MEKVTFNSKEVRVSSKGTKYWIVTTQDGKKGAAFFDPALNTPIDAEEKPNSKGDGSFTWSQPRSGGPGGFKKNFAPSSVTRKGIALTAALTFINLQEKELRTRENLLKIAVSFDTWLKEEDIQKPTE